MTDAGLYKAKYKNSRSRQGNKNTQRDVNVALINSYNFNKMNINIFKVLDAASTKWNFEF